MQQVSGRHSLLSTLALTALAAVGRAEIRQPVTITNPDFTTNLNGWSKTSGTIWTWASNPSGSGGVAKFSKSGSPATHSMWQYYDLSTGGGVLTAPPSTEFGRKLEFGGWVYVVSNFSGKFYLELNSRTSGGVATNVAKTSPWIDGADVPRDKWLYITTEPVSPYDSRLQSNTAVISMVCVVNGGTGDLYFDAAKFGVFEYGELAVDDGSFETYDPLLEQQGLPTWTPGGWIVTPGSIARESSDDAYYGDNSVEVSVVSGTATVFQALGMGGTNGTPHHHHKMEAGAWFKVDSTAGLTSVNLSLVPSGAGISGASPIASKTLYPADITAGKWTFVQTVPDATSPRIPFKVSSNAVTSLTVQFEMVVTDTTVLELDFVQVGELNGITGNPKAFVVADYYPNYRALLASDGSYPGWNGVNQWRGWNSTPFSVNADCDNCPEDCSDMQHDPDDYRANGRRDAACSTENSADDLPLIGAYHPSFGGLLAEYHIPLMQEVGIDAVACEYYGPALAVLNLGSVTDLDSPPDGKEDDKWLDPRGPQNELTLLKLFEVADLTDTKIAPHFVLNAHVLNNFLGHSDDTKQVEGIRDDIIDMVDMYYNHDACLKLDGRMVVFVFGVEHQLLSGSGPRPSGETGDLNNGDWEWILDEVLADTGHEVALVNTRLSSQADYTDPYLESFTGMTTWFPFSFASPHDLRKYSSFCNLADCPTPIEVSPAPAGSLGDSYALALAKRPLQWAAADDTTRLSIGFVYPDFDDTAVSGWGKKYVASPASCIRVLSESLDMQESSWESVIDDSSSATDEGCNWAFIATWNDWNETTRVEPAWRQAFFDDVADPGYDRDNPDQSTYFAQGTIDACLGRLLAVEEGIAAFKGNSAPGASDLDRLLLIAGRYLTGTSWPEWE